MSIMKSTLCNEAIEVLVVGALNSKIAAADIVDGLVVDHKAAVRVLEGGVRGEDRVVWLNNSGSDLRSRVDAELELAFLAIVHGQTFHQESTESRSSTSTERVENEKSLKTSAVVGDAADLVKNLVDELLANGVVAAGVVVGSILFAGDHEFGVEETTISASADLINHIGLKIAVNGARNIFALACCMLSEFPSLYCANLSYRSRRRRC
jgi:hypothetical protein